MGRKGSGLGEAATGGVRGPHGALQAVGEMWGFVLSERGACWRVWAEHPTRFGFGFGFKGP